MKEILQLTILLLLILIEKKHDIFLIAFKTEHKIIKEVSRKFFNKIVF